METKRELRKKYLSRRREMMRLSQRTDAFEKVLCSFFSTRTGSWAAYKALPGEADPSSVVLKNSQINWSFPRVVGETIEFRVTQAESDFKTGAFGTLEPVDSKSERVEINELEGVICPGVAFDRQGHRLGHGKGFYDKSLSDFRGIKLGLCHSEQLSESELPVEKHDLLMDYVATEKELIVIT